MGKGDLGERIKALRKICWDIDAQSPEFKKDPVYWEQIYITRKISIWITFLIKDTRVLPDQVTVVWVWMGLLGAFLLAWGDYYLSLCSAFLIYFSWILDNVDGELARYKKIYSDTVEFLDDLGHELILPLVFAGLTVAAYVKGQGALVLFCGLLGSALVTSLTMMGSKVKMHLAYKVIEEGTFAFAPLDEKPSRPLQNSEEESVATGIKKIASKVFTYEAVLYLCLISIALNETEWFLLFYGFTLPFMFIPKYFSRKAYFVRCLNDQELLRRALGNSRQDHHPQ